MAVGGKEMIEPWPMVPLEKVVTPRKEFVQIDDLIEYKRCRVQLHAQGIVLRDTILGAEIKTKKQQVCHAGEFLVAEIDAKVGGFGIVPDSLEGSIVSSHYFLFGLDESSLDRRFLDYFVRTKSFQDQISAQGSTNYAAIRPEDVLDYKIPLPLPDEQHRIVAHIEELAARIEEARELRRRAMEETEALLDSQLSSFFSALCEQNGLTQLDDLIVDAGYGTSTKCVLERLNGAFPVLRIPNVAGENINFDYMKFGMLDSAEFNRVLVNQGDVLVVRTNGSADLVGRCAVVTSLPEPIAFASYLIRLKCNSNIVEPNYMQLMLKYLRNSGQLFDFARTTAGQYNVSLGRLRSAKMPIPSLDEQRSIVVYMNGLQYKLDNLKRHQADTAAELDALMPSILDRAFRGEL